MEELVVLILQVLFEFVLEVLSYAPFDWPRSGESQSDLSAACFGLFLLGCGLAGISLLAFNHTFLALPAFRIGNLVLAPLASAFLSQAIARRRALRGSSIVPRHRFWQGFWFTSGLVVVRFVYAART